MEKNNEKQRQAPLAKAPARAPAGQARRPESGPARRPGGSDPAKSPSTARFARRNGLGFAALALSLLCAVGYGGTQLSMRDGFEGEIQQQWRDGALGLKEPGRLAYVSGDLEGGAVSDRVFGLTVNAAFLARTVEYYQWLEKCQGAVCKVEKGWAVDVFDAGAYKTRGYQNPPGAHGSVVMATSVRIGRTRVAASATRGMGRLSKPYLVGANDASIPGFHKVDGKYQSFQGEPKIGDSRVSWRALRVGTAATVVGETNDKGDLVAATRERFAAKEGVLTPEEFLDLKFWETRLFGYICLAMCLVLLGVAVLGLWTAGKIERQIIEERRRQDRRKALGSPPAGSPERRQGDRRPGAAPAPRGLAKPKEYQGGPEQAGKEG